MFLPDFSFINKRGSTLKNITLWLNFDEYKQLIFLLQIIFTLTYLHWITWQSARLTAPWVMFPKAGTIAISSVYTRGHLKAYLQIY